MAWFKRKTKEVAEEDVEASNKAGMAAMFSLGLIAGYKGVAGLTHILYITLVLITFIYSGGIVEWLVK